MIELWIMCQTICAACENTHWSAGPEDMNWETSECPNCHAMKCRPVFEGGKVVFVNVGDKLVQIMLPDAACSGLAFDALKGLETLTNAAPNERDGLQIAWLDKLGPKPVEYGVIDGLKGSLCQALTLARADRERVERAIAVLEEPETTGWLGPKRRSEAIRILRGDE